MTLATIKDVVTTLQTGLGAISGIRAAPLYPPEQVGDFPFVTTYPGRLSAHTNSPEQFNALWDVLVEFHVARKDLPTDVSTSLGLAEPLLNSLFSTLKANSIAHRGIDGVFSEMKWGDTDTVGYRFTIREIKIQTTIT